MKSKKNKLLFNSKSYLIKEMYIFHLIPQLKTPKGTFLIIHGFPSWSTKNYDIAEHLCLMGYEVIIPHHKGLGLSNGAFSFKNSISDIKKLIKSIKKEKPTQKISIIGHSWGGFISLQLNQYVEDHLILLAPLLEIPSSLKLNNFVNYFFTNYPKETKSYTKNNLKKEFQELQNNFKLSTFIKNIKRQKLLLIHGILDDLIPIEHSIEFSKKISEEIKFDFIKINEDHRLSKNRDRVFNQIISWLNFN
jgi:esterase/lipase